MSLMRRVKDKDSLDNESKRKAEQESELTLGSLGLFFKINMVEC